MKFPFGMAYFQERAISFRESESNRWIEMVAPLWSWRFCSLKAFSPICRWISRLVKYKLIWPDGNKEMVISNHFLMFLMFWLNRPI